MANLLLAAGKTERKIGQQGMRTNEERRLSKAWSGFPRFWLFMTPAATGLISVGFETIEMVRIGRQSFACRLDNPIVERDCGIEFGQSE